MNDIKSIPNYLKFVIANNQNQIFVLSSYVTIVMYVHSCAGANTGDYN